MELNIIAPSPRLPVSDVALTDVALGVLSPSSVSHRMSHRKECASRKVLLFNCCLLPPFTASWLNASTTRRRPLRPPDASFPGGKKDACVRGYSISQVYVRLYVSVCHLPCTLLCRSRQLAPSKSRWVIYAWYCTQHTPHNTHTHTHHTHTTPQTPTTLQTHAPQRVLDDDLQVPVDLAVGAHQRGLGRVEGGPDARVDEAGDGDGLDQKLAPPRARARVGPVGDHGDAVEVGLRRRVPEPRRAPGVAARGAPKEEARAVHVRRPRGAGRLLVPVAVVAAVSRGPRCCAAVV